MLKYFKEMFPLASLIFFVFSIIVHHFSALSNNNLDTINIFVFILINLNDITFFRLVGLEHIIHKVGLTFFHINNGEYPHIHSIHFKNFLCLMGLCVSIFGDADSLKLSGEVYTTS